jgi:hypothetical protein
MKERAKHLKSQRKKRTRARIISPAYYSSYASGSLCAQWHFHPYRSAELRRMPIIHFIFFPRFSSKNLHSHRETHPAFCSDAILLVIFHYLLNTRRAHRKADERITLFKHLMQHFIRRDFSRRCNFLAHNAFYFGLVTAVCEQTARRE